jgi:hypothetical protein
MRKGDYRQIYRCSCGTLFHSYPTNICPICGELGRDKYKTVIARPVWYGRLACINFTLDWLLARPWSPDWVTKEGETL